MDLAERPSLRSPLRAWERLPDQLPFLLLFSLHLFSFPWPTWRVSLPVSPGLRLVLPFAVRACSLLMLLALPAFVLQAWPVFAKLALLEFELQV